MTEITKTITIAAAPDAVFAALTEPARIVRHFPLDRVESEGRVGGVFRLHGQADGRPFTDDGIITALAPGRAFAYRYWSDNHGTVRSPETELTIAYTLEPDGAGTRLTVVQGNIGSAEYAAMMDGVWDYLLGSLKAALEADAAAR